MAKVNIKVRVRATKRWCFYPVGMICLLFKVKLPLKWMVKLEVDKGGKLDA